MKITFKRSMFVTLAAAAVLWAGCSGASAVNNPAPASTAPVVQNPPASAANASSYSITVPSAAANNQKAPVAAANRVDVIYFHVTQRCVTCLCFEEHINTVIDKYFQDAIASGKLTYKVLNTQKPENKDIAVKYGAVASQLCINVIINGKDNITDIQDIWDWKCRDNPADFEQKVKAVIDQALVKVK
jgi:hypothetical protein